MARLPEGFASGDAGLNAAARRLLLDALDALAEHRSRLILVGAQAVHLHSTDAALAGTAFTSDADLGLDPREVAGEPLIQDAMRRAGFELADPRNPGTWQRLIRVGNVERVPIRVDLLVPELLAGSGKRSANVPPHASESFRRVEGIETAIADNTPMTITSLEPDDGRAISVAVAGVPALLVAKAFKIRDRLENPKPGREADKDAGDVIRLMQASRAVQTAEAFGMLVNDPLVGEITRVGLDLLHAQFGAEQTPGTLMAEKALAGSVRPGLVRALAPAYMRDTGRR
ncbi:MAG: hypothetical protein ACLQFR_25195 [Streptosporangiaceae bacterium]